MLRKQAQSFWRRVGYYHVFTKLDSHYFDGDGLCGAGVTYRQYGSCYHLGGGRWDNTGGADFLDEYRNFNACFNAAWLCGV